MTTPAHPIPRRSIFSRINPFGPIMGKELRSMARRRRSYYLRSVYLLLLLAVLAMGWSSYPTGAYYGNVTYRAQQQAEMGRTFFAIFAMFSVISMMLIGPVLTCTAIGGERLRKTLHVLLMTPISAGQIVSGKLFSRMLAALTLMGLSLPALMVVRLLGGVELSDLLGLLGLISATGLFTASLGLLFSCWMTRPWGVILLSYIVQAFIGLGIPLFVLLGSAIFGSRSASSAWMMLEWLLVWPNPVMATAMHLFPGAPMGQSWLPPILTHVVMSAVLLLWAAAVVRRLARHEGGEAAPVARLAPAPEEPVEEGATPLPVAPPSRSRAVSDWPIVWYETRQPLFRRARWRWISVGLIVGLLMLTYMGFGAINLGVGRSPLAEPELQIGYAFVFGALATLMFCVLSATVVAGEKESDTWTLLIASPVTGGQVILGKLAGVLRRMSGLLILMTIHFMLFVITGVIPLWLVLVLMGVTLSMNMLFVASGLWLSMRCRKTTTAVVLNLVFMIFLWVGVPFLVAVGGEALHEVLGGIGYWAFVRDDLYPLHPTYFYGEAIDRCRRESLSYVPWGLRLNGSAATVFPIAALLTSIGYLLAAALILWRTIARFDTLVGRARTRS